MNMKPFEQLICRTPAFGTNQTLAELLFKIEDSSAEFHQLIKDLKPDELNGLDEKTRFTLWKYFKRAT